MYMMSFILIFEALHVLELGSIFKLLKANQRMLDEKIIALEFTGDHILSIDLKFNNCNHASMQGVT